MLTSTPNCISALHFWYVIVWVASLACVDIQEPGGVMKDLHSENSLALCKLLRGNYRVNVLPFISVI